MKATRTGVDLVFDGQCGFCTRCVLSIQRLDRHHRVMLHPFQRAGVRQRFGLSERQVSSAVWAFGGGQRRAGAGAINMVLDAALGIRIFTAIWRVPGIRQVQNGLYGWVATHRSAMPGTSPWCVTHPGDCDPAAGAGSCSGR